MLLNIHLLMTHFLNLYFPRIWVTKLYLHYNSCHGFIYSINVITPPVGAPTVCQIYNIWLLYFGKSLAYGWKKMSLLLAAPLMYLSRTLWLKTSGAWHTRFQLCDLYSQDLLWVSGNCISACSFPFCSMWVQGVGSFNILYTHFITFKRFDIFIVSSFSALLRNWL